MKNNNFNKAENIGRKYSMQVFVNDDYISGVSFTRETYDSADVDILSAGTYVKAEIKYRKGYVYENGIIHRTNSSKTYDSAIFEKTKYDGLKQVANGKPIFYYMLFSNGIGFKWEITKMKLTRLYKDLCPKTTEGYNNEKVWKDTYHLPFSEGELFMFNI